MKNFMLFCTFMANVLFMNAQENNLDCVVIEPTTPDPQGEYSHSTDSSFFDNCEIVVLNIKFWGINYPNGQNDFPNRAHDALQGIANLNILYNQFGIYFKFRGFEEIDSPEIPGDPTGYYVLETISQFSGLVNWAAANGHKDPNAFNVYAFGWASFGGGIAYMRDLICGTNSGPNGLAGLNLLHEIGHNLNLYHTRSLDEHVTRDPNNIHFNADEAGDEVVDTAANPGFLDRTCYCYPYINLSDCTYIAGFEFDNVNVPYDIPHEDVINLMGDAYVCQEPHLSTGQGIRAREAISAGHYDAALTDVASLYEPYAGEYFVSSTQGSPTQYRPLFQPGFDYKFVECSCDCPEPSPYNDISFSYNSNNVLLSISKYETDFSLITHPNHSAIHIDFPSICGTTGQSTRRCYDNYNARPYGGSITQFNDGVFNYNITVTPKDSVGINSPVLIDNLSPGLYKIEKNYNDGGKTENVILIEN